MINVYAQDVAIVSTVGDCSKITGSFIYLLLLFFFVTIIISLFFIINFPFPSSLFYRKLTWYKVILGAQNLKAEEEHRIEVGVDEVFLYPHYKYDDGISGDIAVLKLKERVKFNSKLLLLCVGVRI